MIAPLWSTQTWWPSLPRLITEPCYLLPTQNTENPKTYAQTRQKTSVDRMRMITFHISGQLYRNEEYLKQAKISSFNPGEKALENNTIHLSWQRKRLSYTFKHMLFRAFAHTVNAKQFPFRFIIISSLCPFKYDSLNSALF